MENANREYKLEIPKKQNLLKAEIVSFLNSSGGVIILGADDDGNIQASKKKYYKEWEEILNNWIFNAFYPSVINLIDLKIGPDFKIIVKKGSEKPYFYKDGEGFNANGVYIRVGSSKRKASFEEIKRMILASKAHEFENTESENQNLTFGYMSKKFREQNTILDMRGSTLINPNGKYNNAALLLSDENPTITKFAIFQGTTVSVFLDKKEFRGSIMKQLDDVREYVNVLNKKKIIITGKPQHDEYRDYPERAIREAICNCYCHRDWTLSGDIKIEFYDDRIMIFSPGSLPNGLTLENIKLGATAKRNQIIVNALDKADYIENYASGIRRIFEDYQGFSKQPKFYVSENIIVVTLYNRNYENEPINSENEPINSENEPINSEDEPINSENEPINSEDEPVNDINKLSVKKRKQEIIHLITKNTGITRLELSKILNASLATIKRDIDSLKKEGIISREGSNRTGHWIVTKEEKNKKL